jgi:lactoylglutathione lyase/glyoxylase I family protein
MRLTPTFDHVGLSVADLGAMVAWYERALGFTVELSFALEAVGVRAAMLRAPDGTRLELLERAGSVGHQPADPLAAMLVRSYGHWAFAVDDIERAFAELVEAGARPVWSPRPAPPPAPGTMAYLADPEGNLIELVAR